MLLDSEKLCALVSSRICHDIINPLGAIGNGLELLALGGNFSGPEMNLIDASQKNAEARIKFLRHAFGDSGGDVTINGAEVERTAVNYCAAQNITVRWQVSADLPRSEVKRLYLAIMCMAHALAFGGDMEISQSGGGWKITGTSERRRNDTEIWAAMLKNDLSGVEMDSATIQFALLSLELAKAGKIPCLHDGETSIALGF